MSEKDIIEAIEKAEVLGPETEEDKKNVTGSKTFRVGCVKVPLPFLKIKVCVDLRVSW